MLRNKIACWWLLVMLTLQAASQSKHALIIAIGNYPDAGGWPPLSSLNDIPYIRNALQHQGFTDISTLTDQQATVAGIAAALEQLVSTVQKGDVVVIHLSAHGEQLEDDNNDEIDGLDECIVAYDAIAPGVAGDFNKKKQGYFRDDLFAAYIGKIRKALGPRGDLIVFMDACHSGSGTRGSTKVRGDKPPLVSAGFNAKKFAGRTDRNSFRETVSPADDNGAMAAYVVFAASRAEQTDAETTDETTLQEVGSLTYALSKSFENLRTGTTYQDLFAEVQSQMNIIVPGQNPVLEGNGTDRGLFGGSFNTRAHFFFIDRVNTRNDITVKAGWTAGMGKGAAILIFPPGAAMADSSRYPVLGYGTVVQSDLNSARIHLQSRQSDSLPAGAKVFITMPAYNTSPVVLGFNRPNGTVQGKKKFSGAEAAGIAAEIKMLPLIHFEGKPELLLLKGALSDSLIIASNGYLFSPVSHMGTKRDLSDILRRYIRYKFLQQLDTRDSATPVSVRLLRIINGKPDTASGQRTFINGSYEFVAGDSIGIAVRNNTAKELYINILDLQPDGKINPVLPYQAFEIGTEDVLVPPGADFFFSRLILPVSPPYGTETLKIFVSPTQMNMEPLADINAQPRAGLMNLEQLMMDINLATNGSSIRGSTEDAQGWVYQLFFRINKKRRY